ncbi:MAG TPA: hypothetical protein PK095_09990, partial [Myxococcota bacterium]|nr:hypothetical protein [Myxococcota bacterium]
FVRSDKGFIARPVSVVSSAGASVQVTGELKPGQEVGTASVIARTPVSALTLKADRFDALVKKHGALAVGVMRLLAERLRRATEREVGGGR